jgi:hypothetical protein
MWSLRKTLIAATAALGLVAAAPTQAAANPVVAVGWVVAALVGGAVVGVAAADAAQPRPAVTVTDEPTVGCYWTHGRVNGVWRRVQVCD